MSVSLQLFAACQGTGAVDGRETKKANRGDLARTLGPRRQDLAFGRSAGSSTVAERSRFRSKELVCRFDEHPAVEEGKGNRGASSALALRSCGQIASGRPVQVRVLGHVDDLVEGVVLSPVAS